MNKEELTKLIMDYNNWKYMNYSECFGVHYKNQVPGVKYRVTKEFINTEEELIEKFLIQNKYITYYPDQKDEIGEWFALKMLKDVKSTNPYDDNTYFKKGSIYRGASMYGNYVHTFGHGVHQYFKEDEVELLND